MMNKEDELIKTLKKIEVSVSGIAFCVLVVTLLIIGNLLIGVFIND